MEERKTKKSFPRKFGLLLGTAFFAVLAFFVSADVASATCYCGNKIEGSILRFEIVSQTGGLNTVLNSRCESYCRSQGAGYWNISFITGPIVWKSTAETAAGAFKQAVSEDASVLKEGFGLVIKYVLYGIFKFLVWMMGAAAALFAWVINPGNVQYIMGNAGLYNGWAMVRDFLNLGFILVLLYIAFCVVFQIGSYSDSWKKMLLMMVIMALLANFSFPIARFIIDVSNVMFYWLVNSAFPDIGNNNVDIFAMIANGAGIAQLIDSGSAVVDTSITYLLVMIVFTFLLALTFLVIAVLFVVRLSAIGILIIFSPIGIIGAAFPWSQKYASQWWNSLFKYAFFAPIMMFMIIVSINILGNAKPDAQKGMAMIAASSSGTTVPVETIGYMAYMIIPVILLWVGLHAAQKFSIVGAGAVTGMADKTARWAGKKFSGYGAASRRIKAFAAERKKRSDEKFKDNVGQRLGRFANRTQDRIQGVMSRDKDYITDTETGVVIGRAPAKKGILGGKRAFNRWRKMMIDANKEEIKGQSEGLEGSKTEDLHKHINGFNFTSASHDDKVKAAAHAKQLISRGKEFEDYVNKTGGDIGKQRELIRRIIKAGELSETAKKK